jgi:acetolactate synthase-1/2/3 large subunit
MRFLHALGAKVGRPDLPVVPSGDGGFGFTMNELATMSQHNIGVVTVVFNDSAYGNVRRMRSTTMTTSYRLDLKNPDFMKLADARRKRPARPHRR